MRVEKSAKDTYKFQNFIGGLLTTKWNAIQVSTNKPVIIKINYNILPEKIENFKKASQLSKDYIVPFIDYYYPNNNEFHLVMDKYEPMKIISNDDNVAIDLILALDKLHSLNIIINNINNENIIYDDFKYKYINWEEYYLNFNFDDINKGKLNNIYSLGVFLSKWYGSKNILFNCIKPLLLEQNDYQRAFNWKIIVDLIKKYKNKQTNNKMRIISQKSKKDLYDSFKTDLLDVISGLKNKNILINKAKIFKLGLDGIKTLLSYDNYSQEELTLIKLNEFVDIKNLGEIPNTKPQVIYRKYWMDYSNMHNTYNLRDTLFNNTFVNFSNNRLGGGWNREGNVQEEQMVQQCPELALILAHYNPSRDVHNLHTRKAYNNNQEQGKFAHKNVNSADPILITGVRCILPQSDGGAKSKTIYEKSDYNPLLSGFRQKGLETPRINILAIAAPELKSNETDSVYSEELAVDMFVNAYEGFKLVKLNDTFNNKKTRIISGLWGAGAFGHNVKMSIALQYLAAIATKIDLIEFTGTDEELAEPVINIVNNIVNKPNQTVYACLESLINLSHELEWKTKS
jgi:hypothetical protein